MDTVPVKGLVALVSVMVGAACVPLAPLVGVVREAEPEAGVVPPPGRLAPARFRKMMATAKASARQIVEARVFTVIA